MIEGTMFLCNSVWLLSIKIKQIVLSYLINCICIRPYPVIILYGNALDNKFLASSNNYTWCYFWYFVPSVYRTIFHYSFTLFTHVYTVYCMCMHKSLIYSTDFVFFLRYVQCGLRKQFCSQTKSINQLIFIAFSI